MKWQEAQKFPPKEFYLRLTKAYLAGKLTKAQNTQLARRYELERGQTLSELSSELLSSSDPETLSSLLHETVSKKEQSGDPSVQSSMEPPQLQQKTAEAP